MKTRRPARPGRPRFSRRLRDQRAFAACAWAATASAQALDDIRTPEEPLVLRDQGSFFVGGESVEATATELMSFTDEPAPVAGHITVNQMYVDYMVPEGATGVPVVMIHGGTVMGKTYETTPDGRMGWYEYFVRQGHPVYVPDQVGRARSGASFSIYNEVRAGEAPVSALPNIFRHADEQNWTLWRFGPAPGEAFPDTQFPVEAAARALQAVRPGPDLHPAEPQPQHRGNGRARGGARRRRAHGPFADREAAPRGGAGRTRPA